MKMMFGYCCVSMLHPKLKCSRASTKTYLDAMPEEKRHDYLVEKARQNLMDLRNLLIENRRNDILAYRVPEQLLPQVDLEDYTVSELSKELKIAGQCANDFSMQLSTHPSQYFVLNSLRSEVVERTVNCLNLYAEMLECMELDQVPNMTLHLGMKNGYSSAKEAMKAFCTNFEYLSDAAKRYLVLENDHVSFSTQDCLYVHEQIGIPIVFDNKHYEWNPGNMKYEEAVLESVSTWKKRTPKLHLSSDREQKKHAHYEWVHLYDYLNLSKALCQAAQKTGQKEYYLMLECKQKDAAILRLREEIREYEEQ